MEIRSYRTVFDLERRIYRVDRLRLNPGGVPVRGVVYFALLALAGLVVSAAPLLHRLVALAPFYFRELALPGAGAALLAVLRIDGRPAHLLAVALLRDARLPRRLDGAGRRITAAASVWRPEPLLLLPDGSEPRMRRMRYRGPGAVVVFASHQRAEWRRPLPAAPAIVLTQLHERRLTRPRAIVLGAGTRMRVR
ncbi:MAG: hypothetical protein ACYCUM_04380 [Solirubrobacteraceae bacterium]